MDPQIKRTLGEILAEAEKTKKANLTEVDLQSLKNLIELGWETEWLKKTVAEQKTWTEVRANKIAEFYIDQETIDMIKEVLKYNGIPQGSIIGTEAKRPASPLIKIHFDSNAIEGIVLMHNNSIAIYRKGIELPAIILMRSKEDAEAVYNQFMSQ